MKKSKEPKNPKQSKRGGDHGGVVVSVVLPLGIFFVLLQLFDPLASTSHAPGAVHVGLEHFSSGHLKDFNETHVQQASQGKEHVMQLLEQAGIDNLSPEQINKLPTWHQVTNLYGNTVVIVGKESCETFRNNVPLKERIVGVAGLFNTGTNLLDVLLTRNVHGVENVWQVPWGKHRMAVVKYNNTAQGLEKYNKDHVLPVVIVRDPLAWMQSMCSHPYTANWRHEKHHCPNMVPNDEDRKQFNHLKDVFQVTVKFDQESKFSFASLPHLWTEWHEQYMNVDYPVLFVRFEDLVFSPREVLTEIADCIGAKLSEPLKFQVKSSKAHGSGTDFFKAILKTADAHHRMNNLTQADKEYAQEHLSPMLMRTFHYQSPLD